MGNEHFNEPLLYIDQPVITKPKAYMQVHYRKEKGTKEKEVVELEKNKEETTNKKEGESFRNLSIDEKIKYLMKIPTEVPNLKCEIITEDETYRGVIVEEKEEDIVLRMFGRGNETVEKHQIKNIHLIGF